MNNLRQVSKKILNVLELFSAEYLSIDSELQLFRKLPKYPIDNNERSVYNRRKRKLALYSEEIRCKIAIEFSDMRGCPNWRSNLKTFFRG